MGPQQSLGSLVTRLLGRGHRGMSLGLDRTLAALRAVGDPHAGLRAFHVAGSNGKGSTAAMLDAALAAAGVRRGLYTSPHLERINERIQIDGAPIADDAFASALERTFREATDDLTFFETLTVAAFVAFREAGIDVLVLEVGLGGRLDSTNVVDDPLAAGVVSITVGAGGKHLEHADKLGSTIEEIAREKAGIFKRGAPAILGPVDARARRVLRDVARDVGASPIIDIAVDPDPDADRDPDPDHDRDHDHDHDHDHDRDRAHLRDRRLLLGSASYALSPSLLGAHQVANAAVAASMLHAARARLPSLTRAHIEAGISSARWPGRLERLEKNGVTVLLDAAHNLDGARVLVRALEDLGVAPARTSLVFGALGDKSFAPFLALVAPFADRRFYAEPGGRAAAPLAELAAIAPGVAIADARAAVGAALAGSSPGDLVLVTGSIYLVGTVRAHLLGSHRDPAVGL